MKQKGAPLEPSKLSEYLDLLLSSDSLLQTFALSLTFSMSLWAFRLAKGKVHYRFVSNRFVFFSSWLIFTALTLPVFSFWLDISPYLVYIVMLVMTSYLLTSFLNQTIKNPILAFLVRSLAWGTLFFHVTGLLKPTLKYLDTFTIKVGTNELSLLALLESFLVIGLLIWGALLLSRRLEEKLDKYKEIQPSMRILFEKLSRIFLLSLSIYIGLNLVGIDLSVFAYFAGALGVSIALSIQNVFSNFFCGFILLFDRSIKPGDVISLENGKICGVVRKLHARYVSVKTREGKEHLIPNEQFISAKLENWSFSDPFVRVEIPFVVALETDLSLLETILLDIAANTKRILRNPAPSIRFSSIEGNAVHLKLRIWIDDPQNGMSDIKSSVIKSACNAFHEKHIRIPFPPREIHTVKSFQNFSEV